jgi:hypothetical protein
MGKVCVFQEHRDNDRSSMMSSISPINSILHKRIEVSPDHITRSSQGFRLFRESHWRHWLCRSTKTVKNSQGNEWCTANQRFPTFLKYNWLKMPPPRGKCSPTFVKLQEVSLVPQQTHLVYSRHRKLLRRMSVFVKPTPFLAADDLP